MASTASCTPSRPSRRPAKIAARERLEIRLAGQRRVEWLEPSGRGEQQRRGVAAAPAGEHDLRAQPLETRALKLVERARARRSRAARTPRRARRPRTSPGPRPAHAVPARRGIGRQLGRSLRGTRPPPRRPPRPGARSAERSSSSATASSGPAAACARCHARRSGSASGIGRLGQRSMRLAAVGAGPRPGRPRSARADDGSAPGHRARSDPAASAGAAASAPIPSRSAARHSRLTSPDRLGAPPASSSRRVAAGSDSSRRRKLCSMRLASGCASGSPNPPASSRGRQTPRQLQQRERVPAGLGDDPVPHPLVEPSGDRRVQQRAGVAVAESGRPRAPEARRARRPRSAHAPRTPAPTGSARSRRATNASVCAGRPVEPLRVVDDADERLLLGRLGQQAEHRQPDEEAIRRRRRRSGRTPCLQRVALRARQSLQPVEHRRAELMQAGEGELHLGLDAGRPGDPASRRACPAGGPAARSCRRPPRRAGPAPDSDPRARLPAADPAPRTPGADHAAAAPPRSWDIVRRG